MRKLLSIFAAVIFSSILLYGCSGEEPSMPPQGKAAAVVKKTIEKPPAAAVHTGPASRGDDRIAASSTRAAEETASSDVSPKEVEKERSMPAAESAQKPEPSRKETKSPTPSEEPAGVYLVKRGDTLAGIAGKREVYGDRLKWPIVYRMNAQALDGLPAADHLPDLPLMDGIRLRIATRDEVAGNLEKRAGNIWVVNVLSAITNAEVIPAVISLVKNDYTVYVSNARVHEKEWMRVRVGFFRTKEEAESAGKRIMGLLGLQDSWVTKLTRAEFAEYAGY
jgi:cell division septation protein DedD